jgi:hypothetical protein
MRFWILASYGKMTDFANANHLKTVLPNTLVAIRQFCILRIFDMGPKGMRTVYVDLFSGIGGFALGASISGIRFDGHYFSEIDSYAVQVYQKRFPQAIGLGDITKIDWKELCEKENKEGPARFMATGGFP